MIQPSLIQQLRKILDEYPDDGQVLKVKLDFGGGGALYSSKLPNEMNMIIKTILVL